MMLSAAFIFVDGTLDDEFFRLDSQIEEAAKATDGYLGVERWVEPDGKKRNSTYYWRDDAALKAFANNPTHLEAKRQYQKWYDGFHVVISRIEKTYGDGALETILPDSRAKFRK
jgi:heme-degrading monooxygenase HmoA